jgi:hypothetical protein
MSLDLRHSADFSWLFRCRPLSRAGPLIRLDPGVPLRSTPGFMLPPAAAGSITADLILAPKPSRQYTAAMASIVEVEKLALDLPENQRALLASRLLGSLTPVLHDEDEGIAEALLRDAEFETNPALGISLEQLDQKIDQRRR